MPWNRYLRTVSSSHACTLLRGPLALRRNEGQGRGQLLPDPRGDYFVASLPSQRHRPEAEIASSLRSSQRHGVGEEHPSPRRGRGGLVIFEAVFSTATGTACHL